MKLLYFAWVRERIGLAEESVELPTDVATVGDLVRWLAGRGEGYELAFAEPDTIRVALDHQHAAADDPITGVREIALFPPMTGG